MIMKAKRVSLFLDLSYIKFTSQNIVNIVINITFQIVIVTIDMCNSIFYIFKLY